MVKNKDLYAFLNPVEVENKEIIVSDRFKDSDGKTVPWVIKAITQEENQQLMNRYTKKNKNGEEIFDRMGYQTAYMAASVVYPDLQNAELQKRYGVLGAEKLLQKMLYSPEFMNLFAETQRMGGMDVSDEELISEVKNE